jgi:hypothetical protein
MKKSMMFVFAVVANFTLVSAQVQIFAGGSIQSYSDKVYQFGVPVDIRLDAKFAISTGISYAANKSTSVINQSPVRGVREPGGSGSGLFSGSYFEPSVTLYYKQKTYNQNFLSIPLALKYNTKADENRTCLMLEAGINFVYAVGGQVNQYEVSNTQYEKEVTIIVSKLPNEKVEATPVETFNYANEGVNRLNAEWRLGLGMRLPGNFQLAIRWENTMMDQFTDNKSYSQLKNGNAYFSVNVPVYKIKKKS